MSQEKTFPLISVIIPIYNVENYVGKCIESVLNQTYKNLEVLLINDGSTDDSYVICERYATKYERIRLLNKENGGVSSARNLGIEQAKGKYIGFVDADDYIDRNMYMTLYEAMEKQKVDVAICGYYWEQDGVIKHIENRLEVPMQIMNRDEILYCVYKRDEFKGVANYVWNRLYKREIFDKESLIRFNEKYCVGEDIVFNTKVQVRAESFLYIDKPLYYYVQRLGSAVHDKNIQLRTLSLLDAYEEIYRICKDSEVDEEVLKLIKRFNVYWCGVYLEFAMQKKT